MTFLFNNSITNWKKKHFTCSFSWPWTFKTPKWRWWGQWRTDYWRIMPGPSCGWIFPFYIGRRLPRCCQVNLEFSKTMNFVVDKLLLMDRGTRATIEQFLNNVFNIFRILCEELNQCECYYQKITARPIVDRLIHSRKFPIPSSAKALARWLRSLFGLNSR